MSKAKVKRDANKIKSAIQGGGGLYFPGPIHVVEALTKRHNFRTIPENGSDREPIYSFNGQIYERSEELIKQEAHLEYIRQWKAMKAISASKDKELTNRLENALNRGPSANDINEVLSMIRRTTFSRDKMNPTRHIPFKNGLLNLNTRKLEPFSSDLFYTYQIDANLLNRYITLKDAPKFSYLLNTAFYQRDVPMVLAYSAYSFHPDFPQHKVLFVLGRQRIGKGTLTRMLQGLMPKGSGSISLARLLTSERFAFTGIEGKNLLIDSETKRKFRRGTVLEWSAFCNLFGKDVLSVEPKGHEAHDYVSMAKGIFLGNLPFIPVDSPPAIARILLVVTKDEPPKKIIPDLDEKILESERDVIATLLMQILFKLIDRDFIFPGQLSDDETAQLLNKLADPVENFIEEETEYDKDSTVPVDDAYLRFREWCKRKGIPAIARQTFVKKFSHTYPKRRSGPRGNRVYVFSGCYLYEDEIKIEDQVGHGSGYGETVKLTGFANEVTRVQHEYYNPPAEGEKVRGYNNIEYSAQKLDTPLSVLGNSEIQGSTNIESVSNLKCKNQGVGSEPSGSLGLEHVNSDVQNENSLWRVNPKKALFDLVEIEAPKARYHSLLPKAIFDMIPDPEMTAKRVYELCEQLTDEGAFLKNKIGAYSVNTEFLNGGGYQ
ncbi:MAG: primase-like DNA-binding domain-containing protein [Candidatus Thermoplasmatota archaeon]|nr:primase-like DNA-binding domain-containing protein [Candidatus Thermoplasmatota archaeon]